MAVDISNTFRAGTLKLLFEGRYDTLSGWDVARLTASAS